MSAAPSTQVPAPRRGWAPIPNQSLLEWPRLLSGNVQFFAVMFINSELHPPRDNAKVSEPLKWTRAITHAELACVCRCTIRAVEMKLKDLVERKILDTKKTIAGTLYSIPYQTWPDLPDVPSQIVSIEDGKDAEESVDDDQSEKKGGDGIVHELGVKRLKAGKKSRASKLPQPAEKVQYEPDTDGVLVSERMINGVLVASIVVKPCIEKAKGEQTEKPKNFALSSTKEPLESTKQDFSSLHKLLDDYCRHHHGTIPGDKLLTRIVAALGKATLKDFEVVFRAKIRSGPPVPMPILINLAQDAARGVATRKPPPAEKRTKTADEQYPDEYIVNALKDLADPACSPFDKKLAREILGDISPSRIERMKAKVR